MMTSVVLLFASSLFKHCYAPFVRQSEAWRKLLPLYCVCVFFSLTYFLYWRKKCVLHLINAIIYSRLSRLLTIGCTRCNKYICLIFVLSSLWWTRKKLQQIVFFVYSGPTLSFSPLSSCNTIIQINYLQYLNRNVLLYRIQKGKKVYLFCVCQEKCKTNWLINFG